VPERLLQACTMHIDFVLILCAGFGTRMGKIGQQLPKALLPIFEKKLIDIQIEYAKRFEPKKILINVHHHAQLITRYIETEYGNSHYPPIQILKEDPILDSGGAIHNVKRVVGSNQRSTLLTLNGDQLVFFNDEQVISRAAQQSETSVSAILPIWVKNSSNASYNQIKVQNNLLKDIIKSDTITTDKPFMTYSGISLTRLDKLPYIGGPTRFFDSVANYHQKKIWVEPVDQDQFEYWDFGTVSNYVNSLYRLLDLYSKNSKSHLVNLADKVNLINSNLIYNDNSLSYNSQNGRVCLKGSPVKNDNEKMLKQRIVSIGSEPSKLPTESGICLDNIFEPVEKMTEHRS
jgi:NDP-sugar pyrophosphorylase family protein